ncbi:hypothetical protein MW887_008608 [Aspergillus wentii]|nr:hypothetical protein MW887_008608 [Aspergillus wentii]
MDSSTSTTIYSITPFTAAGYPTADDIVPSNVPVHNDATKDTQAKPTTGSKEILLPAIPSGSSPAYFLYSYSGGSNGTKLYPTEGYNAPSGSINPCSVIPDWNDFFASEIKTMPESLPNMKVLGDSTCHYSTTVSDYANVADSDEIGTLECHDFQDTVCHKELKTEQCGPASFSPFSRCSWD